MDEAVTRERQMSTELARNPRGNNGGSNSGANGGESTPPPTPPKRPETPAAALAKEVHKITDKANTVKKYADMVADPKQAAKDYAKELIGKEVDDYLKKHPEAAKVVDKVNELKAKVDEYTDPSKLRDKIANSEQMKQLREEHPEIAAVVDKVLSFVGKDPDMIVAELTNFIAAALGPFPGTTMTNLAMGLPHAHIKHPPSGPPPVPPTPLPPFGPIMLGNSIQVLINNKPSARCGDFGLNPTCCGIVPPFSAMYEIFTGSSNVFIGGSRAARAGIDITFHCKPGGGAGSAGKMAAGAAKLSKLQKVVATIKAVAAKVSAIAGKVAAVGAAVSEHLDAFVEAEAEDDGAMMAAVALNAAMTAAQMAADAIAMALSKQMGTDQPAIPPTGTPGMILNGSPNVLIGGLPLPPTSKMAEALGNRLKGLKGKFRGGGGGGGGGSGPGQAGPPGKCAKCGR
jgi:uncharacterized Zn-binding protein involved in type VI secretion